MVVLVFSIPAIQTRTAHRLTDFLNEEFGTEIHIERIAITLDAKIDAKEVYIGDHHNDTLITSESLKTSLINISGLIDGKHIDFGDVTAEHLTFRLRRYKEDGKDNFGIFLDKLAGENSDKKGPRVNLTQLQVIDSKFSFVDEHVKHPKIISLNNLNIVASDFIIQGSDISVNIERLKADERRGMEIENLSTKFAFKDEQMNFDQFSLTTPDSKIKGVVHFSYDDNMHDFENRVRVAADFKESQISTTDLHYYYDKFGLGQQLHFYGRMNGVLNDFNLSDFHLKGMNYTGIDGQINIKNIFGDEQFRLDGNFNNLETGYDDLVRLLPPLLREPLPEDLKRLGKTQLQGQFSTTGKMVSTNSTVRSEIGKAKLDASLSNLSSKGNETYNGTVEINDFDLGELLNNSNFGDASFILNMEGKGLSQENLDAQLDGSFSKLTYKNYIYRGIIVEGRLENPVFDGEITSYDPNLLMTFDGRADVSDEYTDFVFNADVSRADLNALNLLKTDSVAVYEGEVTVNMTGNNLDDFQGNINISEGSFKNSKDTYKFDRLNLNSSFKDDMRTISISSPDIIDGQVEGHFFIDEIPDLFKNAIGNIYSNYSPVDIEDDQYLDFDIAIHSKIVEALFPEINVSPGTSIKGKVRSSDANVALNFESPEIKAYNNKFKKVDLRLDNVNPLSTTYFNVDEVSSGSYDISEMNLISKRRNDTLFVRTKMEGGADNRDKFNLNFFHTINKENESVVGIRRSNIKFNETTWFLNKDKEDCTIVFNQGFKNISIDTINLSHENQNISFHGFKRGANRKEFNLDFQDVDLKKITPSIKDFELKGTVAGQLKLDQTQGIYYPVSDLTIDQFAVNDIDYGDFNLDMEGDESLTAYAIRAKMTDGNQDFMKAEGKVNVAKGNSNIDLDIELDKFKVGVLNALSGDVITDIRGTTSGKAHFGGNFKNLEITGDLGLNDAGLKIPYLNVDLDFEENAAVKLNNQEFYFDNVALKDTKYKTEGTVDGTLAHTNFKNWRLDLALDAPERLLVLDTEYSNEALFYGRAYISGNARIAGPFDELLIDVTATSEKGTAFNIPLSDGESLSDNNYIYFLTPEDLEAREEGRDIVFRKLKGLELNFDLDITDDADIEIVVDKKSGSTLKGTGAGTLLMEINTNGKFNMWGDYVVYDGIYNFKYAGLIEKQFEVVSGGNITWDGSPTQANLDVRAKYKTEANPSTLLENPTVNRSIPIDVFIDLSGMLTDVDIDFEIEYPNLSSVVKSELEYRISDRENTEIQALSLITQRSFYSDVGQGNTHPENLLFERAAGLFNDIFSSSEDKFQVGVDYTKGNRSPEQEISDRVGVTLSTNVSERVLINGKVGVPIGGLTQTVVVGDIEVEVLLNEEGTLRAKVFNRESDIQYIGEELGYTQGVGLSYSVDFNTFKEMIRKILKREITASDLPEEMDEEEKENIAPDYIDFPET